MCQLWATTYDPSVMHATGFVGFGAYVCIGLAVICSASQAMQLKYLDTAFKSIGAFLLCSLHAFGAFSIANITSCLRRFFKRTPKKEPPKMFPPNFGPGTVGPARA